MHIPIRPTTLTGVIAQARTNPVLAEALDATPFQRHVDALDRLQALAREIPDVPTDQTAAAALSQQLLNGGEVTALDDLADLTNRRTQWTSQFNTLSNVATQLAEDRDQAIRHAAPAMYAVLDKAVKESVATMRKATIEPGSTADDAIRARKVKEWQSLQQSVERYRNARSAQLTLNRLADASIEDREALTLFGEHALYVSNIEDVTDNWAEVYRAHVGINRHRLPWPNPTSPEYLNWLTATAEAQVWVPNPSQLVERIETLQELYRDIAPGIRPMVARVLNRSRATA